MVVSVFQWFWLAGLMGMAGPAAPGAGSAALRAETPAHVAFHPFYVSVTEIHHNVAEKTLEIGCKLFADDFENALKSTFRTPVDLTHPKEPKLAEKMVNDYVQRHLRVSLNGKPAGLQFVGYEKDNEAVWCYFEVRGVGSIRKMELLNTLLYESFATQIGIMHVSVGSYHKSTKLNNPDSLAIFEF